VIGDKSPKSSLGGTPPNLANPPEGCRFHPRCREAREICKTQITHDLATAYYISDRIVVMLRGYVVEAVLGAPLHPYTQLLKESVPSPVPTNKEAWVQRIGLSTQEVKEYNRVGCKFAGRCPRVSDRCREVDPPDVEAQGRTVKYFLYAGR